MGEINLKLKSYDELIFEITTLNTNKYLLEQKLNKQKEVLDKIKEYIKENACYDKDIKQCCRDLLTDDCDYILELLEEIE